MSSKKIRYSFNTASATSLSERPEAKELSYNVHYCFQNKLELYKCMEQTAYFKTTDFLV